jgi:hypothetical protein
MPGKKFCRKCGSPQKHVQLDDEIVYENTKKIFFYGSQLVGHHTDNLFWITVGEHTREGLKYYLGKCLYHSGWKGFEGFCGSKEGVKVAKDALQYFYKVSTQAEMAVLTFLCISKYVLKNNRDVSKLICNLVFKSAEEANVWIVPPDGSKPYKCKACKFRHEEQPFRECFKCGFDKYERILLETGVCKMCGYKSKKPGALFCLKCGYDFSGSAPHPPDYVSKSGYTTCFNCGFEKLAVNAKFCKKCEVGESDSEGEIDSNESDSYEVDSAEEQAASEYLKKLQSRIQIKTQ